MTEEQQFLENLKPLVGHLCNSPYRLTDEIDGVSDLKFQPDGRVYYMNLVYVSNDNKLPETNLQ